MKRNALFAAIAATLFSAGAMAAEMDAQVSGSSASGTDSAAFAELDANADGNLSRDEVTQDPRLSSQWDTLDANRDGNVDQSEFSALEGNVPSVQTPGAQPPGAGAEVESGASGDAGISTAPGQVTEPGASEAAPGRM